MKSKEVQLFIQQIRWNADTEKPRDMSDKITSKAHSFAINNRYDTAHSCFMINNNKIIIFQKI